MGPRVSPARPGPLATRAVLQDSVTKLYELLSKSLAQMSYDHAQKVLNTEARVLTSEASIEALYEAERKKLMGAVLKQAAPILKDLRSWIEEREAAPLKKNEEEEDAAIQAHKREQKMLSDLSKQWDTAKAALAKYDKLRTSGKALKTRNHNEAQ